MHSNKAQPPIPSAPGRQSSGWRRIAYWWDEYQWSAVGLLALLALALGHVGFARYSIALGEPRSALDVFYLSLQLFTLESGAVHGPVPIELQVARLLAPAVLGYTAVKALLVIFREQLHRYRTRVLRGHVIVCGLGRKGAMIVKQFRARGYDVVGIEQDAIEGMVEQCRGHGATVFLGDATDRRLLALAGVRRAARLFAVCGNDGANAEIAVHARALLGDRRGPGLTCFVHIRDLALAGLLREREITGQRADAFRLEFFNVYDNGTRAMLAAHPPFRPGSPAHVLVVGLSRTGTSLLVRTARSWHALRVGSRERLRLTVVDPLAARKVQMLCAQYPRMESVCDIAVLPMEIPSPEFQRAAFLPAPGEPGDVTAVYVCLGDDAAGLSAALALRRVLHGRAVPIVVSTLHEAGLGALLRGEGGAAAGAFDNLYGFGLLERGCEPELLLGGTHEIIARAIHEEYVRDQRARGQTPETNPSMRTWEDLPEALRQSSRRQADHIGVKLASVGCTIAPLDDWDAELFEFTPTEIENLAEKEHERWVEERVSEGWRPGPKKDIERKISPYLIPWGELTDEVKEYDRVLIRGLPAFLAKAGFMIRCGVRRAG